MIVGGLDPSLVAMAATTAPLDWAGQWSLIERGSWGYSLKRDASERERIVRCERVARAAVDFLVAHQVEVAYLESYGYSQPNYAHSLGELGGILRLFMLEAGIDIRIANMSSARKLLLGYVPRSGKDAKEAVWEALQAAGGQCFDRLDETDAFCVLNWGMKDLGGPYVLAQEPPPKLPRVRKLRGQELNR
jgi:hypothetical protein